MDLILTQTLNGLVYGVLLFLLAAGLSLIFGLMGVVNLAHGSFFMLGAFCGLSIIKLTGSFWWAVLLAPIPVATVAVIIEVFFLRPTYSRDRIDQVLLTFGFSFVITDLVESIWGREMFGIEEPDLLDSSVELFGGVFPSYRLALLGFGIFIAVALWLIIEKTRVGAMVRAGVDDPHSAMGIGLNVPLLLTATFAGGAALAGLAGVIAGPLLNVFSGMDVEVTIPAFVVIVIGGMGSLKGSAVASVLIGIGDTFGKAYAPSISIFLIYFAMIVILLIRPAGLYGQRSTGV
jgi:branched-subunit amino acid ABC-type transport system permease component